MSTKLVAIFQVMKRETSRQDLISIRENACDLYEAQRSGSANRVRKVRRRLDRVLAAIPIAA